MDFVPILSVDDIEDPTYQEKISAQADAAAPAVAGRSGEAPVPTVGYTLVNRNQLNATAMLLTDQKIFEELVGIATGLEVRQISAGNIIEPEFANAIVIAPTLHYQNFREIYIGYDIVPYGHDFEALGNRAVVLQLKDFTHLVKVSLHHTPVEELPEGIVAELLLKIKTNLAFNFGAVYELT